MQRAKTWKRNFKVWEILDKEKAFVACYATRRSVCKAAASTVGHKYRVVDLNTPGRFIKRPTEFDLSSRHAKRASRVLEVA